jgi:hypothetical protein
MADCLVLDESVDRLQFADRGKLFALGQSDAVWDHLYVFDAQRWPTQTPIYTDFILQKVKAILPCMCNYQNIRAAAFVEFEEGVQSIFSLKEFGNDKKHKCAFHTLRPGSISRIAVQDKLRVRQTYDIAQDIPDVDLHIRRFISCETNGLMLYGYAVRQRGEIKVVNFATHQEKWARVPAHLSGAFTFDDEYVYYAVKHESVVTTHHPFTKTSTVIGGSIHRAKLLDTDDLFDGIKNAAA